MYLSTIYRSTLTYVCEKNKQNKEKRNKIDRGEEVKCVARTKDKF